MHIAVLPAGIGCVLVLALSAQTSRDPGVAQAEREVAHVKELFDAGVASHAQVEASEQALREAEEDATLRRTLYGRDVTEEQADEMVALTGRRLERRREEILKGERLVNEGVASRLSLTPLLERIDLARKENDYAIARAKIIHDLAAMAQAELALELKLRSAPRIGEEIVERGGGDSLVTPSLFDRINHAFEREFSRSLPVSAFGQTAVHRALGFDHSNRVDVALSPDQPEGIWLRRYLGANHIPYFAFRVAVRGKATGPHIHIGPMSPHMAQGG